MGQKSKKSRRISRGGHKKGEGRTHLKPSEPKNFVCQADSAGSTAVLSHVWRVSHWDWPEKANPRRKFQTALVINSPDHVHTQHSHCRAVVPNIADNHPASCRVESEECVDWTQIKASKFWSSNTNGAIAFQYSSTFWVRGFRGSWEQAVDTPNGVEPLVPMFTHPVAKKTEVHVIVLQPPTVGFQNGLPLEKRSS